MPDILAQGNLALRSMREPGKAFKNTPFGDDTQPGHMQDYQNMDDDPASDNGWSAYQLGNSQSCVLSGGHCARWIFVGASWTNLVRNPAGSETSRLCQCF